jgi:hypothetical protein
LILNQSGVGLARTSLTDFLNFDQRNLINVNC